MTVKGIGFLFALLAGLAATAAPEKPEQPKGNSKASGVVYDLDCPGQKDKGCQVAIRGTDGPYFVNEKRLRALLAAALVNGGQCTITFDDKKQITGVVVTRQTPGGGLPPKDFHLVDKIDMTKSLRQVTVVDSAGKSSDLSTLDPGIEQILVTAFAHGWRVGYLTWDERSKSITRCKLNVEDQAGMKK